MEPKEPCDCTRYTHLKKLETSILPELKMYIPGYNMPIQKAASLQGLSTSQLMGACGMPGCTAYFGFLELCHPKAGVL